ncbi:Glutathione hydrolase proenzyme [Austwickia sp. TVS 96-490-7B]|nr:Glutathione hydrolase proenzyme [Austwickia sp. TVS 96-490-7B]
MRRRAMTWSGLCLATTLVMSSTPLVYAAEANRPQPPKVPTAVGTGGAVTTVDNYATEVGLSVLRDGGNAVDAAVATAAALGVTEPYSAGIGGGGYFMYYEAKTKTVHTLDGRETAPRAIRPDAFIDPKTGKPYQFTPHLVTSGVSVGVPGTPATWEDAVRRWGTKKLGQVLEPAAKLAHDGFVVDETFRSQTLDNKDRFAAFPDTAALFLPKGDAPAVGTVFTNPDLAATYRLMGAKGVAEGFYAGPVADGIVKTVNAPKKTPGTTLPVPPGSMTAQDLKGYRTVAGRALQSGYRGYTVHGMNGSSAGGTTVGEALRILEKVDLTSLPADKAQHQYLAASALAFADRAKYTGDPAFVKVPTDRLLSTDFATQRACLIAADKALVTPVKPGDVTATKDCHTTAPAEKPDTENISTTNLTVADKWGNIVEYTLSIEQTGGSGMVVPGRGFLLNNELTDFTTVYDAKDPNRIEPGKRPRSSMSPTIITRDGTPFLALGSPGGSTIITTVLQTIVNRLDLGMTTPQALAAPRASLRNTAEVTAEPEYITSKGPGITAMGYKVKKAGDAFTSASQIGAATAIEFDQAGGMTAAAEPVRRGGGSAGVLTPRS